jgi:hypothetical protein
MRETLGSIAGPLDHVVTRFRSAEIIHEPYPHYVLNNVFPDDFYRTLIGNLPGGAVYQRLFDLSTLKLDHFRHRDQTDLAGPWTEKLPEGLKQFWDSFDAWFLGPELADAVLKSFAAPLGERFGTRSGWPEVSVEAQLIRHRAGYFLQPHSDLHTKLVVLLLYLAPDESASHLGTTIYRPKDPDFSCPDSAHHPFEDFVRVSAAPYRPNSLLAFLRSDRSFHGVEPISETDVKTCDRELIQYVLYDGPARRAQLRERRLVAGEGSSA